MAGWSGHLDSSSSAWQAAITLTLAAADRGGGLVQAAGAVRLQLPGALLPAAGRILEGSHRWVVIGGHHYDPSHHDDTFSEDKVDKYMEKQGCDSSQRGKYINSCLGKPEKSLASSD